MDPRIAALLLAAALLAGCSGSDSKASGDPAGDGTDGTDADATTVEESGALPTWQVGQWWEWQASFGTEQREGTFCSIVAGTSSGYDVVTEDLDMAKQEATFTHPLVGAIGTDLTMLGWGGEWKILDFPLTDGKTWTAEVPNIAWDFAPFDQPLAVAMAATYDEALPGFRIMGHVEQGMLLEATYLPATGWFGELNLYDLDVGEEGLEVGFKVVSAGLNYTGPTYSVTAERVLLLQDGSGLDAPPPEGQPFVSPQPQGQFTMAADTILYGGLVAETVLANRVITLTDPNNEQRQVVSSGDLDGDERFLWIDEPAVPGQWTVVTSGAGGYSSAYVELYALTVTEATM